MILVTGGTGFIGSHVLDRLAGQNHPVRALVRSAASAERLRKTGIDVLRGDLAKADGIAPALRDVDIVIHLAGVTKALAAADYYAGNARATENLARAIRSSGRPIRMVHVSSLAAIGPAPDSTPLSEDSEPHPLTPYGKSKLEGERLVSEILPDAVIVRPPVVYGPRDTDVFQLLRSIDRGVVLRLAGGERWFSAIYAPDLAAGILAAAHAPRAVGRRYFLAHPHILSWSEFGTAAAQIMGRKPHFVNVPATAAHAAGYCAELWSLLTRNPGIVSRDKIDEAQCRFWVCSTERAKAELGFEAATGPQEALTSTIGWYREAGWLK